MRRHLFIHRRDAGAGDFNKMLRTDILQETVDPLRGSGNLNDVDIMRLGIEDFDLVFFL